MRARSVRSTSEEPSSKVIRNRAITCSRGLLRTPTTRSTEIRHTMCGSSMPRVATNSCAVTYMTIAGLGNLGKPAATDPGVPVTVRR